MFWNVGDIGSCIAYLLVVGSCFFLWHLPMWAIWPMSNAKDFIKRINVCKVTTNLGIVIRGSHNCSVRNTNLQHFGPAIVSRLLISPRGQP